MHSTGEHLQRSRAGFLEGVWPATVEKEQKTTMEQGGVRSCASGALRKPGRLFLFQQGPATGEDASF